MNVPDNSVSAAVSLCRTGDVDGNVLLVRVLVNCQLSGVISRMTPYFFEIVWGLYRRLRAVLNPLGNLAAVRHQPTDDEMRDPIDTVDSMK